MILLHTSLGLQSKVLPPIIMYSPHVQLGNPDQIFEVGPYSAQLHSKVISTGMIYYRFLLAVNDHDEQPCLYVTSVTDLISG